MIFDTLQNAKTYYSLDNNFEKALKYLENNDLTNTKNGKYELNENTFIIIQDYSTKPLNEGKWEAHKKYIDIQFIIKGQEKIGFTPVDKLKITEKYNEENDIMFLDGNGDFIDLHENEFVIFFPQDAHMPGLLIKNSDYIKKAVIKIKV